MSKSDEIAVERVERFDGLDGLATNWQRLQDAYPTKHVLMDWRWARAWWQHFGRGRELHLLVLRRAGRIVGIAPLMLSAGREAYPVRDSMAQTADDQRYLPRIRHLRWAPIRRVGFLLNLPAQNVRAHLLLEDDDPALYAAVMDYWAQRSDKWDLMALDGLPGASPQRRLLQAAARQAGLMPLDHGVTWRLAQASLQGSLQAFLSSRSKHFRSRLRSEINRSHRAGRLDSVLYKGDRIRAGLKELFAIEQRSWKRVADPRRSFELALDERTREFLSDVATAFSEVGEAAVFVTEVDGRSANAVLTLSRQGIVFTLVTYLDEEFRGRINSAPLFLHVVEHAVESGAALIDINGTTLHARKWSNQTTEFQRLYVFNRNSWSRFLGVVKIAATFLSRALRRMRAAEDR